MQAFILPEMKVGMKLAGYISEDKNVTSTKERRNNSRTSYAHGNTGELVKSAGCFQDRWMAAEHSL